MKEKVISSLLVKILHEEPIDIERCTVGHGSFVYIVKCINNKYVIRCSNNPNAYDETIKWLDKLAELDISVPRIVGKGTFDSFTYIILTYIEGTDIGNIYLELSDTEKRDIAREIIRIQNKVALLDLDVDKNWSWCFFIQYMLERAKTRIAQNNYFDLEKVERVQGVIRLLKEYFNDIKPLAYLDDVSSKNLLIYEGKLNGIIDIDWIGIGDRLTFVALTNMAFLDLGYDTDYIKYLLEELNVSKEQYKAFLFYSLMYCVDFMGERGMTFMDKKVDVNESIVNKLNGIYEILWAEFTEVTRYEHT